MLAIVPASVLGAAVAGTLSSALIALAAASATVNTLAWWWLEAQVARPLEWVAAQARKVAAGDTRTSLHLNRVDEIGMTLRAVNQLDLMFRWVVDDVCEQVLTEQSASSEIAQGIDDLSARTEQAAASLEETAASMEQISSTVRNNSDAAQQAADMAGTTTAAAAQGGGAVRQVNATMEGTTASSRKIGTSSTSSTASRSRPTSWL